MAYYLGHVEGEDLHGVPFPAAGARVVFDRDSLLAARERLRGGADADLPVGDEGLVVVQDPLDVLSWPCRLWRVGDLERVVRPTPWANYLWCQALTVYEEVPGWLVMGPRGDAVVEVIEAARSLTGDDVAAIAAVPDTDEARCYRAVWWRWADQRSGSPVGCGLLAVNRAVEEAARRVDPRLFGWDDDDELEVLTDPAWQQAAHAATAAALASGAAEILEPGEHDRLTYRWVTVVGPPRSD